MRNSGRGRSRLPAGSLMWDWIPKSRIRTWWKADAQPLSHSGARKTTFPHPRVFCKCPVMLSRPGNVWGEASPGQGDRGDLRGLGLLGHALWALLAMGSLWAGEWRQFLRCTGAFVFSCIAGLHLFCRERFWTQALCCWEVAARPAWLISSTKCWALEAAKTCVCEAGKLCDEDSV